MGALRKQMDAGYGRARNLYLTAHAIRIKTGWDSLTDFPVVLESGMLEQDATTYRLKPELLYARHPGHGCRSR